MELNSFQLRAIPARPFTTFPCPATSGGATNWRAYSLAIEICSAFGRSKACCTISTG
jgi:hypothetical protein